MKKAILLTVCILTLILFSACGTSQPSAPPEVPDPTVNVPDFTEETLPRLDGSTATIPLSEGIVKSLLGYDAAQAQAFVHHNTTHNAYVNLIDGRCDLIFVTPPSEEEYALMEEAGGGFAVEPVVKDAFVFLVNRNNPVDDISLSDLQKIYRGEITNWKELGGSDAPILPFQRPDNSGSQTLMYKLLVPKAEIMDAPTELRPSGMDDLVDAVSDYDEGLNSIGYSVFYYASGMYTDPDSKLISVDGVLPTAETIADGTYPLTDGYYAVYPKESDGDTPVGRLLAWLRSDAGQRAAAAEGYVPLSPLQP
ncbi:MAG: PstS family phosphate ABC transporter substrate-binding protein [Butyricicoccaceae bacterium]